MIRRSQRYGQTIFLPEFDGEEALPLRRRPFDTSDTEQRYGEDWLQSLLFRHPQVLPFGEIEPVFAPAIPICRELPTAAGPIDNVFVSEHGLLTLVECKLWRNPEARREAVVQILDYAKEIGRWSYEDLLAAVRRVVGGEGNVLFDLVRAQNDTIDEREFVDDVSRNLAHGRFLLMIVGDGIREGVERITEFLQNHIGLRFTFALVELAVFDLPDEAGVGGTIVEPRLLARTVEIERGVLRREVDDVEVAPPDAIDVTTSGTRRRSRISEEEFFDQLKDLDPEIPDRLRAFFQRAEEIGLTVTVAAASMILHWWHNDFGKVNFGTVFPDGTLNTNYIVGSALEAGDQQIGERYLEGIASFVEGAQVRRTGKPWTWKVMVNGSRPDIGIVLDRADEWLALIEGAVAEIEAAIANNA